MPGRCTRGMVLEANLDPTVGHEIRKSRPCLVIQNDVGNAHSPTTIVAAITGADSEARAYPVHVPVGKGEAGLTKDSVVLCEQLRTVDESRFVRVYGKLSPATMEKVDRALKVSLALP